MTTTVSGRTGIGRHRMARLEGLEPQTLDPSRTPSGPNLVDFKQQEPTSLAPVPEWSRT
jgi:hypothetical protein